MVRRATSLWSLVRSMLFGIGLVTVVFLATDGRALDELRAAP
jgi:hypothetical protein